MRWLRAFLIFASIVSAAVVGRALRLRAFESHVGARRYEDVYYLPSATWLPLLSLGYRQALADVIWCRSLVYFGDELVHRGQVKYMFDYTDAVLALEPDFLPAYRWIPTAAVYRPTTVDVEISLRAARYLKRAIERWPDEGELYWEYGSALRFDIAPVVKDRAQKSALLEEASPYLETAARLGAGPPWLAINSVDLLNKLGRTEQAIRHLEELYSTVKDPEVREEIEARLSRLRSHTFTEGLRAAMEQFEAERSASYPYMAPGLFLFVGSKPPPLAYERYIAAGFLEERDMLREEAALEAEQPDGP